MLFFSATIHTFLLYFINSMTNTLSCFNTSETRLCYIINSIIIFWQHILLLINTSVFDNQRCLMPDEKQCINCYLFQSD